VCEPRSAANLGPELTRKQLPGVFPAEQPTTPAANGTGHRLPSGRFLTSVTGLLVRNHDEQATVKLTGVCRDKLIGTAFSDYAKAEQIYQLVFSDGMAVDYPLTLRHLDQYETFTEVL
jgi:hypothetical protein